MDDSALRQALQRLLSHGDAMEDSKLLKAHAAKSAKPEAPEMCPECKVPLEDGTCPQCGYSAGAEDGEMASLLERGAEE